MSASEFRKKSNQRRQVLIENLVESITGIARNTPNFRKAVKFSIENIDDHQFLSTMPSVVDRQYKNLLDKLEFHSQIGKLNALQHAVTRLRGIQDVTKDQDREDFVYSCMRFLYHLSDRVLDYNIDNERAISHHRQLQFVESVSAPDVHDLVSSLRSINEEFAGDSGAESEGTLSDWSDEEETVSGEKSGETLQKETTPMDERDECEQVDTTSEVNRMSTVIGMERKHVGMSKPVDMDPSLGFKLPRYVSAPPNVPLIQTNLAIACAEMDEGRDSLSLWRSKYLISHEQTVVQQVLQMLAGRTGSLFTWQGCTCGLKDVHVGSNDLRSFRDRCDGFLQCQPVTLTHLSPESLSSILGKMMKISTKLERLRRFSRQYLSPDSGKTLTQQAFGLSVSETLESFDEIVNGLIRTSHSERPTLQVEGSHTSLTLIVVERLIDSKVKEVDLLTFLAGGVSQREVPSPSHSTKRILDFLFDEASMTRMLPDEGCYDLLHGIFTATLRPYLHILDHWLAEGSLENDTCNEFFIQDVQVEQEAGLSDQVQPRTSQPSVSRYWQMFAIRQGGDIVDEGKIRSSSVGTITISRESNSLDDFYTGMTITVTGKNGKLLSAIVKGYIGAKRRVLVDLEDTVKEDCLYVVTTVVPAFFRPLCSRILSAGKSVNVLLYDGDTKRVIRQVLTSQRSILSTFEQRMKFRNRRLRIGQGVVQDSSSACSAKSTPVKSRPTADYPSDLAERGGGGLVQLSWVFQQIHASTTSSTERVDDLFHVHLPLNDDMSCQVSFPDSADCSFSDLPPSSLRHFLASADDEEDEEISEDLESSVLPFEKLMEEALLKDLERRVEDLNEELVKYLVNKFDLIAHLNVLRRVYFMAAGDVLHEFAMHIFQKLDRNEPWNDPHTLNSLLQSSLPPSKSITYGTISAQIDAAQDPRKRKSASDASIFALDGLYISYSVEWPLNLIVNEQSLKTYNNILIFLMQIKRAKIALNADTHADKNAIVKDSESEWEMEELQTRDRIGQDASSAERYGSPNTKYLLLRAELRHVVNNLENYIMTQIHGSGSVMMEKEIRKSTNLDQIHSLHLRFLSRMRDRCLLHERAAVVADTARKVLDLALNFSVSYPRYKASLQKGEEDWEEMREAEESLDRVSKDFHRCTRLLVVVLSKIVSRGFHPHLEDLLVRLSFNDYFDASDSRR
ncbi:hypothetical protein GUITHDRAFT_165517 [Guillardia theta CCMP2712]|uniref:Spindle pole body component n=2 Tax=Guillardia theta TaxID=55529 RepID=L1IM25_GUITC|nr:hypothetical protein GUITHDRAFT_165517 [Guillardia theta CCMP2712]EKX37286.1 hypothetical protein GUITHDRAFT_165517 [Guillardia theta CCMP2712]|eukprot:XP_005824266.1 hypothetical protein GUITHDRAFT_165517 [Guillardia theta CCMP2712]